MNLVNKENINKIGVISDTHIPTRAKFLPNSIHEYFKGVDFIIHCGDIVDNSVITELETIATVCAVKGNMDPHEITFGHELIIKINNKYVVCVSHGYGSPFTIKDKLYKVFTELPVFKGGPPLKNSIICDVPGAPSNPASTGGAFRVAGSNESPDMIIFGHTHKAYNDVYKDIKFFNPGSATSGTDNNSIGIINVTENGLFGSIIEV